MSPAASPQRATATLPSPDLLHLEHQLSGEERQRLHTITEHLQSEVRHQSVDWWNREELARDLLPAIADLGLGRLAEGRGSRLFQNLVHAQIARADLSLSAMLGIHNELIVGTLEAFGSEEQKRTWLPGLKELRQL